MVGLSMNEPFRLKIDQAHRAAKLMKNDCVRRKNV